LAKGEISSECDRTPVHEGWIVSYANISTASMRSIGIKKMNRMPGLSGLGDGASDAVDAGIDSGMVATLQAMGATDGQLEAVAMNPDSESAAMDLLNRLTGNYAVPTPGVLQQQSIQQTGMDLTDPANWYNVTGQLQNANSQLQALEASLRTNAALAAAIGPQVIQLRNEYQGLATKWIQVYGTVFGSTPAGLAGMGVISVVVLTTAIIATAAVVIAGLAAWWAHYNTTAQITVAQAQVPAQTAASATQQALISSINSANASGNTALASSLASQLAKTGYVAPNTSPSLANLTTWFTTNWPWVAGIAVVMALGPNLVKKL
jgi:hypothetical protein